MTRVKVWMVAALVAGAWLGAAARGQSDGSIVGWGEQVVVPQSALTDLEAVAAGGSHSLGLKADGSIVAWGLNNGGQCTVPAPNTGFVAVAAGVLHSLGLKADGSIVAWGNAGAPPAPNTGFVAVAAGWSHSLGLKADGSIVAWGDNSFGQSYSWPSTGFVAVAAGLFHSLGVKADGSIVAWGGNSSGQCNIPAPNTGFVAVAGGGFVECDEFACYAYGHSLGLRGDGSIVAWGDNSSGQCNVPAPNTGFVAVAGGPRYSLGLKADGSIVAWGTSPGAPPAPNTGFVGIAAGDSHSLGLSPTARSRRGDGTA